jgi:cell division protein ZapD
MQEAYITFEQPLNEYIRICLRVEHLVKRVEVSILGEAESESRTALEAILEILNVIDRPDLKSKLAKALSQHAGVLTQLEQKTNVDHEKLQAILVELDQLVDSLYNSPDRIGQELRTNSFLNTVRQYMANPGGASPFATPAYYLWLRQPAQIRIRDLLAWFSAFEELKTAVRLLLQLTRGSSNSEFLTAEQGFYQRPLDPKLIYHLLRVSVPVRLQLYPEISVGRHRLIVRFLELNVNDRGIQRVGDVDFELTCCLPLVNFI